MTLQDHNEAPRRGRKDFDPLTWASKAELGLRNLTDCCNRIV